MSALRLIPAAEYCPGERSRVEDMATNYFSCRLLKFLMGQKFNGIGGFALNFSGVAREVALRAREAGGYAPLLLCTPMLEVLKVMAVCSSYSGGCGGWAFLLGCWGAG